MAGNDPRIQTVQHLARQLRRLERGPKQPTKSLRDKARLISTGIAPLDGLLPGGGMYPGSLVEWLAHGRGSGAGTLIFLVAASVTRPGGNGAGGNLVVIDFHHEFCPSAADRLGIDLQHTIVVRPANGDGALWALEQSLRCPGVAVVVGFVEQLGDRVFRRLQLAAERGGGLGLLLRSARFRDQPSWADLRLRVIPRPVSSAHIFCRRLRVELVRCRGQTFETSLAKQGKGFKQGEGGFVELEIHDETGLVHLVTELAPAENSQRASRA